jgi:molybdopterin molybdotransferase
MIHAPAFCCDDRDPDALPADVALQRILTAISPIADTETETLPLLQVLDRILSVNISATMNVPAHNNSAMDGYAVNAGDLPADGIRELRVIGSSFAGHPFSGACLRGECIRIMTGAMLPKGLDTVIPQEHVEVLDESSIRLDSRTRPGDNVRHAGEDIHQGQIVLKRGRRIRAADLGLLASLGLTEVSVIRRLRVAFFSTGDELRSIGQTLQEGEIYDSNRYTLHAMLLHQHCLITDMGVVRDDPHALRSALQTAAIDHDIIITSGGVSVGAADYVRQVLSELGNINFWKIASKPGRPLTFGKIGNAWFFGLPGNPVAVMVSFFQLLIPALQHLAAETPTQPLTLMATTTSALKKKAGRTEYQRGILSQAEDGSLIVSKTGNQGSGILLSMSLANCFIILPDADTHIAAGDKVMVQAFNGWM